MVVYPAQLSAQRITEQSYVMKRKNGFRCLYQWPLEVRLELGCQGLGYSLQAVCVQWWGSIPVADLFSPDSYVSQEFWSPGQQISHIVLNRRSWDLQGLV